jgi:indole-3-glycerol phosphate synthase
MNILQKIAERTKERIENQKKILPAAKLIKMAEAKITGDFPFERALRSKKLEFICEIKKASPSKGIISEHFPYIDIAKEYEAAGAAAISVLTEPHYFMGEDRHLCEIAEAVKIPLLRKDFTIDSYMIYEAKAFGASAALFICALLDGETLEKYIALAHSLGLSALVETRSEDEIQTALSAGARIIGVNNRDLKTFEVNISQSEQLRKFVPPSVIFVSESGITSPGDIKRLQKIGADAALIGEGLMKSADKKAEIERLRGRLL